MDGPAREETPHDEPADAPADTRADSPDDKPCSAQAQDEPRVVVENQAENEGPTPEEPPTPVYTFDIQAALPPSQSQDEPRVVDNQTENEFPTPDEPPRPSYIFDIQAALAAARPQSPTTEDDEDLYGDDEGFDGDDDGFDGDDEASIKTKVVRIKTTKYASEPSCNSLSERMEELNIDNGASIKTKTRKVASEPSWNSSERIVELSRRRRGSLQPRWRSATKNCRRSSAGGLREEIFVKNAN